MARAPSWAVRQAVRTVHAERSAGPSVRVSAFRQESTRYEQRTEERSGRSGRRRIAARPRPAGRSQRRATDADTHRRLRQRRHHRRRIGGRQDRHLEAHHQRLPARAVHLRGGDRRHPERVRRVHRHRLRRQGDHSRQGRVPRRRQGCGRLAGGSGRRHYDTGRGQPDGLGRPQPARLGRLPLGGRTARLRNQADRIAEREQRLPRRRQDADPDRRRTRQADRRRPDSGHLPDSRHRHRLRIGRPVAGRHHVRDRDQVQLRQGWTGPAGHRRPRQGRVQGAAV